MRTLSRALVGAACALAAPLAARAQSLDVKAGFSYATLSNKDPDWNNRSGFVAGLGFDLGSGPLSLQPEVLYAQKGVSSNGSPSSAAPKLDYIDVPVLIKLSVPIPIFRPFAYAGPSVSFRLSCTAGDGDCSSDVKSTDYGVVLGAGAHVLGLLVEGRYSWGLQDIHDISAGLANQTRTFQLLVGFTL